jgi:hypothetical protein
MPRMRNTGVEESFPTIATKRSLLYFSWCIVSKIRPRFWFWRLGTYKDRKKSKFLRLTSILLAELRFYTETSVFLIAAHRWFHESCQAEIRTRDLSSGSNNILLHIFINEATISTYLIRLSKKWLEPLSCATVFSRGAASVQKRGKNWSRKDDIRKHRCIKRKQKS